MDEIVDYIFEINDRFGRNDRWDWYLGGHEEDFVLDVVDAGTDHGQGHAGENVRVVSLNTTKK